jgi:hypothetical protein
MLSFIKSFKKIDTFSFIVKNLEKLNLIEDD